jgi:predicted RNA-binding Zn ribbon-like protein
VIVAVSLNGMTLPSWASHLEHKLAPMPLLLVQAFVNTLDLDLGTDVFAHPEEARAWLADSGLRDPGPPSPKRPGPDLGDDLLIAREVRTGIRALIRLNTENKPLAGDELQPLQKVAREGQPRLQVSMDGQVRLGPALPASRLVDGLLRLLLITRDAQADGSWDRMKLCGNPDCQWAFYDRSHSRRGAWCDMASCGNRLKNRNLRARRASRAELN